MYLYLVYGTDSVGTTLLLVLKYIFRFATKGALLTHTRVIHEKLKPFVCDTCGHAFAQRSNLDEHVMRHGEAKNFVCNECNKRSVLFTFAFHPQYLYKLYMYFYTDSLTQSVIPDLRPKDPWFATRTPTRTQRTSVRNVLSS